MRNTHIGIIGGGQLGMLLTQAAVQFPAHVSVYDPHERCPASYFTHSFVQGAFDDYEKIVAFGKDCDAIIFETERVNIEALKELEAQGKTVLSSVSDLEWIQNKLTQRAKLRDAGFPVPEFSEVRASEVRAYSESFPVVQKWQTGGYDGQGVKIHIDASSLQDAAEVDSVFEEKIDIQMELSVLVARDKDGNTAVYPPVEMVFHEANLVDYLVCPARIDSQIAEEVLELGKKIAEAFDFHGIYAIELFIDSQNRILVNEVSPRTHNSGHHTVSTHLTSQYEQQIRIALGLPLGSVQQMSPCVLLNLLADDSSGVTHYKGLREAYSIPKVQYVLYGKDTVRPFRKMGHALIIEEDVEKAIATIDDIRKTLTITSNE